MLISIFAQRGRCPASSSEVHVNLPPAALAGLTGCASRRRCICSAYWAETGERGTQGEELPSRYGPPTSMHPLRETPYQEVRPLQSPIPPRICLAGSPVSRSPPPLLSLPAEPAAPVPAEAFSGRLHSGPWLRYHEHKVGIAHVCSGLAV